MDIKRTILIVALAVVSYVMVLKWNQDYGQAALPTQNVAASTTTAQGLPDSVPGNNASTSADVPTANADTSTPTETPVAASKDLIRAFYPGQRRHKGRAGYSRAWGCPPLATPLRGPVGWTCPRRSFQR